MTGQIGTLPELAVTVEIRRIVSMTPLMRSSLLLLVLFPAVLLGTTSKVVVQVTARMPLVVTVDGPGQVVLAPGEMTRIRVGVAANVPWVLDVRSPNAWASVSAPLSGPAGGVLANSREVAISCSSHASGPQSIALVYTLMPR